MIDIIAAFTLLIIVVPGLLATAGALFELWTSPEETRLGTT